MTDDYTSSSPRSGGVTPSATDTATQQAADLRDTAADAGSHLLGEAKGEASAVAQEARRQLGDLWSVARGELSDQARTQQHRLAGGLSTVGGQLTQMADAPTEQSLATDLARELGDRVTSVGRWLEAHHPEEALDEIRGFARRRPGTFLLIAAGAGVALGRLTRGLKDAPSAPAARRSTSIPTLTTTPAVSAAARTPLVPVDEVRLAAPVRTTSAWDRP